MFLRKFRIKFILIDIAISGVMACLFIYFIYERLIDWLIHYPINAVITVAFTSCHTLWWTIEKTVYSDVDSVGKPRISHRQISYDSVRLVQDTEVI